MTELREMDFLADCLEHKALLQESSALTGGFRYGIKTVCQTFHSNELLVADIYQLSLSNAIDPSLPERVVNALLERVKNDPKAFEQILESLHKTTSMGYLAVRLEKKRTILKEEHARIVAAAQLELARKREATRKQELARKEETARKMQFLKQEEEKRREELVVKPMQYPMHSNDRRPTDIPISGFREAPPTSVGAPTSFSTGPAYIGTQSAPFNGDLGGGCGSYSVGSLEDKSMVNVAATYANNR